MNHRVCFVSMSAYGFFVPKSYSKTGGGGARRQVHLLATALAEDFDVGVVVGDYGQDSIEVVDGVTLIKSYSPCDDPQPIAFLKLIKSMHLADADIYVYRGTPKLAAVVYLISKLLGRDFVYHFARDEDIGIHYESNSYPFRVLFERALSDSRTVIAQSDHQQDRLQKQFGVDSVIIPNGYPKIEKSNIHHGDYFLWVGRLNEEQKRPHLLVDIIEELPEYEFRVIGTNSDSEYATSVIETLSRYDNVEYIDSVPPNEISDYYSSAIALINTSKYEGFPNTFLEAWRCGTPVVSLDVDPGRFLEKSLYSGYADGELDAMLGELRSLSTNALLCNSIGVELKGFFEEEYSIDRVTKHFIDVIAVSQS